MQDFKLAHFDRDHPGEPPPGFEPLGAEQSRALRARLSQLLLGHGGATPLELVTAVADRGTPIPGRSAEEPGFSLTETLSALGVDLPDQVLVNWHRFDEIDRFSLRDLARYFEYIWYPAADDIDIFDDSLAWILSVRHDGELSILRSEGVI